MKMLVVANQKGGVGKTATAVHQAFYASELGCKVLFIDLEPTKNATYSLSRFDAGYTASELFTAEPVALDKLRAHAQENDVSLISGDEDLADLEASMGLLDAANRFRANVTNMSALGFDVCIVDTGPSLGVKLAAALLSADFVVSPIEMEAFSIQGIKQMLMTIGNLKRQNGKLEFIGMIPTKVDSRNERHVRHEAELRAAYPDLITPHSVGLRSSIAEALSEGIPVWQIKRTAARKAAKEVRALSDFICKKMEIL